MNKYLVIIFVVFNLASNIVFSMECNNRIDESKAIVFIDNNNSYKEVLSAMEAACERGENIIVLPQGKEVFKRIGKLHYEQAVLLDKREIICKKLDEASQKKCVKLNKDIIAVINQISKETLKKENKYTKMNKELFDKKLQELAKKDIAITSLIASGHNGGGNITGSNGRISKLSIIKGLKEAYKDKPDLLKKLQSILLWGCYTTTPGETIYWRKEFPHLNIIAGFDGSGPSHIRDAGKNLLKDVLVKENILKTQTDKKELQHVINKLKNLNDTLYGIYVKSQCSSMHHYQSLRMTKTTDPDTAETIKKFTKIKMDLDNIPCTEVKEMTEDTRTRVFLYQEGIMEIPANTQDGILRGIYQQSRQYAALAKDCNINIGFNSDQIGLLLFYHGVYDNYLKLYKDDMRGVNKVLEMLNTPEMRQSLDHEYQEIEKKLIAFQKVIHLLTDRISENGKLKKTELSIIPSSMLEKFREEMINGMSLEDQQNFQNLSKKKQDKLVRKHLTEKSNGKFFTELSDIYRKQLNQITYEMDALRTLKIISSYSRAKVLETSHDPEKQRASILTTKAVITNLNQISTLMHDSNIHHLKKIATPLKQQADKLNRYLYQLDTDCMDFLDWHESIDGHVPVDKCAQENVSQMNLRNTDTTTGSQSITITSQTSTNDNTNETQNDIEQTETIRASIRIVPNRATFEPIQNEP